jgi:hypothetical protein
VHFKGKCSVVDNIICFVPCETHYNKKQPFLVMRGFASAVIVGDNYAVIK